MSYEPEQEMQEGAENAEGQDGAGDGTDGSGDDINALNGGGEMAFVAETKQPMNKGTLIVVGLLIACGAATYFMYVRSGPDQAVAMTGDPRNDELVKQFINGSDQNAKQIDGMLKSTEKVVQQFKSDANGGQVPLASLASNPFMRGKAKPNENRAALEREEQLRLLKQKATESVAELRLQTIIHRDPKKATCMINNTLYRKGQKITVGESKVVFTVAEIRPDAVTVSSPAGDEVLKFELKMKQ
jgi:hypothetical protein